VEVEEHASRLRGIGRLVGGILVTGVAAAIVIALVSFLLIRIGPDAIVVDPGTTTVPPSQPAPTAS
jgi:hypothetical protein